MGVHAIEFRWCDLQLLTHGPLLYLVNRGSMGPCLEMVQRVCNGEGPLLSFIYENDVLTYSSLGTHSTFLISVSVLPVLIYS
jgi:hypothetical protein